jgi:hypothetical protein
MGVCGETAVCAQRFRGSRIRIEEGTMTQITIFAGIRDAIKVLHRNGSGFVRRWWTPARMLGVITAAAAFCVPISLAAAAPAAGDVYVYRLVNGYNRETIGYLQYEFTAATTAQGSVVSVTGDTPSLALPVTEIQTQDGQWLRHRLDNHGIAVDYEFTPALPSLMPPLAPGKSWTVRVNARVAGDTRNRSVRIDGDVLGQERIRVPAGEFDT